MEAVRNTRTDCVEKTEFLCYTKTGDTYTNMCCIVKSLRDKFLDLETEDKATTCNYLTC